MRLDGRHRTCTSGLRQRSLAFELHPQFVSFCVAIIHNERPIKIGQEAGFRTRTVSFTMRDAADYTTFLNGAFGRSRTDEWEFTKLLL